jgi:hypothetical protein
MTFDIRAIADDQATVYLRWGMGPADRSNQYSGWNIDDVEIWGMVIPHCPGDFDGDNDVDLADLSQLLGNYGMTSGAQYEDGDLDGDGDVDLSDLAILLAAYGTCDGDPNYNPVADLDGNDCVDLADLAALLANYGTGG